MNRSGALLFAVVPTAFACLGLASPQIRAIDRVRWMTGCWEAVSSQRSVYEQWTPAQGGAMLGTGRTIRRDSLVEFEFVVLRENGGGLAYEAHPSGQAGATFHAISITDSSVTFENLANDFPQRVGYNRRGADSVIAWISGPRGGTTRRIDFPYKRARCAESQ
jgi:hypothetical protein